MVRIRNLFPWMSFRMWKNKAEEYERYVAYRLSLQGFTNIVLTAKTGDFGADILATDIYGIKWAVQCKCYSKPVGYKAVEEALSGAHYYGCQRAMVVTNSRYTKSATVGAKRLGVELYTCR